MRVQRDVRARIDIHSGLAQGSHRPAAAGRAVDGGVLVLVERWVDPPDHRHGAEPRETRFVAVVVRGASSHAEDRDAATRWATALQSGQVSQSHATSVGSGRATVDPHSVVTDSPGVGRCNVACRAPSAGRQKKGCITNSEETSSKLWLLGAWLIPFCVGLKMNPADWESVCWIAIRISNASKVLFAHGASFVELVHDPIQAGKSEGAHARR